MIFNAICASKNFLSILILFLGSVSYAVSHTKPAPWPTAIWPFRPSLDAGVAAELPTFRLQGSWFAELRPWFGRQRYLAMATARR